MQRGERSLDPLKKKERKRTTQYLPSQSPPRTISFTHGSLCTPHNTQRARTAPLERAISPPGAPSSRPLFCFPAAPVRTQSSRFDGESASWQRLCAQHTLRLQNLRPADASSVASRPGLATISPQRRTTEADQAASLVGRHPTPETADRALKPCAPAAAETHQPCWTWRRGWPRRPCAPPHRR